MSLKLALVLVLVALAGQGFALPTKNIERASGDESLIAYAETAVSTFIEPKFPDVIGGIRNCFNNTVQIVGHVRRQISLFLRGRTLKLTLFVRVMKCFFQNNVTGLYNCGFDSFARYRDDARRIDEQMTTSRNQLRDLVQNLPRCFQGSQNETTTTPYFQ